MKRTIRRVAIAAVVLLGLGASGLMCQRVGERGRYVGAFSTYGAGPDGTRGLFLLAERLDAQPERWAQELGRLPDHGMLVALGSCEQWMRRPLGRLERETLSAWVEGGGVLLVAGVPGYATRGELGVDLVEDRERCRPTEGLIGMLARAEERARQRKRETEEDEEGFDDLSEAFEDDPVQTYEEVTATDELPAPRYAFGGAEPVAGMPAVGMRRPLAIDVDETRPRRTLLRLDGPDGPVAGVRVDVGRGAVIALSSASLFQNRDLSEQRGGLLFARLVRELAPRGPILFDEYHLGVGQRRSMMRYLRQAGMAPVVLQVLVLIGLLIWRFGFRFGGTREPLPEAPGGTASYVEGVGTLYAKAADPPGTLGVLAQRALERIAEHHHVRDRSADKLARQLEDRGQREAAESVRAIARRAEEGVSARGLSKAAAAIDLWTARAMK